MMITKIKQFKTMFLAISALFGVVFVSCDTTGIKGAIDDFGLVIGLEAINTGATVLITDAATGELINANVVVTFAGQSGGDVIDLYSDPVTEDEVKNGILNFALHNEVVPTSANPAKVTLQLSAPGYVSANRTVALADTGFTEFSVSLVNDNNKPAGIKTTSASATTNSDGSLAEDLSINTNSGSEDEGINITFPAGTILTDADGNKLSGNLTAEITNYDPGDPNALANSPVSADDASNFLDIESENSASLTLGMSSLNIRDDKGKVASKISESSRAKGINSKISVAIEVSPQSGLTVGDSVYYWAITRLGWFGSSSDYDLGTVAVIDLEDGKIGVQFEMQKIHPLIFVFKISTLLDGSFNSYSTFDIQRNGYKGTLKGTATSYGLSYFFKIRENGETGGNGSVFFNSSGNFHELHITDPVDAVINYDPLPASGSTLPITLPQAPSNLIDAKVNVALKCPDSDQKVAITNIPQSSIVFRKAGATGKWRVITFVKWDFDDKTQSLTGGSANLTGVEKGADYDFKFNYDGKTEEKIININGANVTVTISEEIESVCE